VIAVAADRPSEVVAYVMDPGGSRLRSGLGVELMSGAARQVAVSEIQAVGPVVERLPESLWGDTQLPRWGRPLLVRIPPGFDVAVGEMVDLRLR
jgi:hypothetical protein